jgi:pre-mRNA-processing factor 6
VKLEWENGEVARARALLERARAAAPSARVWMKSALLEREAGDGAAEARLLAEGTARFPAAPKLWMMRGQAEAAAGRVGPAREAYAEGRRNCPASVPLWLLSAALEEEEARGGGGGGSAAVATARARMVLESARHRCPGKPELWLAAVRLERRWGFERNAEALLARGLQEMPASGPLLAEDIEAAPRHAKKRRSQDALARVDNSDPHVVLAVARLFAAERKVDKARKWFSRAVALAPKMGDAHAAAYAFELAQGDADSAAAVAAACEAEELVTHGELWAPIAKARGARLLTRLGLLKRVAAAVQREEDARRGGEKR